MAGYQARVLHQGVLCVGLAQRDFPEQPLPEQENPAPKCSFAELVAEWKLPLDRRLDLKLD